MDDLTKIYSKNLFFTLCVFFVGLALPYSRDSALAILLLILLVFLLFAYLGKLLLDVIKRVSHSDTSIKELRYLFITLAILCAGSYFFIGIIDSKEQMISGLREIKVEASYELNTLSGFFGYAQDLVSTYLNSLYYSIVVMSTLGDSKIIVEGGIPRFIIAFEVGAALSLTVFKIGEHYSKRSTLEAKATENRIIEAVKSRLK
ncbi:hypothetical protein [Paraglaciecola sp.]|uniref:hypothetical protein n=1 Tax=Paraglaciecola sp. TaxID=1920173 RepID=UPI0032630101